MCPKIEEMKKEAHEKECEKDGEDKCCEFCGGTGEVSTDESDGEGHIQRGVGTEKCICQLGEPDDMSGATEGDR